MKPKSRSSRKSAIADAPPLPSPAPPHVPDHIPKGRAVKPLPPLDAYPPWRSMSQVCRYLDLSLPTVYRMCKTGELESYAAGGRRRVTVRSIEWNFLPPSERTPLPKKKMKFEAIVMPLRWPGAKRAKRGRAETRVA